jgi:Leucine-rich repeat (LRR) protein
LNLNFNSITDITPLSNLLNLNYLGLVSNYIENVSPLCGLGNSFDGNIDLGSNPLNGANITALRICLPNATIDF